MFTPSTDVTPVSAPAYAIYQSDRGAGTPFPELETTRQVSQGSVTAFEFADAAPTITRAGELSGSEGGTGAGYEHSSPTTPMSERHARVALLVKQFEGDGTIEDVARFEILTARMRKLERAQDEMTLARIGDSVAEIGAVHDELQTLKHQFGL